MLHFNSGSHLLFSFAQLKFLVRLVFVFLRLKNSRSPKINGNNFRFRRSSSYENSSALKFSRHWNSPTISHLASMSATKRSSFTRTAKSSVTACRWCPSACTGQSSAAAEQFSFYFTKSVKSSKISRKRWIVDPNPFGTSLPPCHPLWSTAHKHEIVAMSLTVQISSMYSTYTDCYNTPSFISDQSATLIVRSKYNTRSLLSASSVGIPTQRKSRPSVGQQLTE